MNIPAEGELLLCCARTRLDGVAERLRELAAGPLDWPVVRALAERHKVTPLLLNALSGTCAQAVPAAELAALRADAERITTRNQANLDALLRILRIFAEAKIPVFALKGAVSALADYGSLGLRICGDIDLLVHRPDFLKAKDLLLRNGWHHMYFGQHEVATAQAALHDGKICVDLHYGITPHFHVPQMDQLRTGSVFRPHERNRPSAALTRWFFYLECDELWQRLVQVRAGEAGIPAPAPEDALLVATIQGIKENWQRLTRVCDFAQIAQAHPALDWDRVLQKAIALGCERKFLLGALLAHRLLDAPVPAQIVRRAGANATLGRLVQETSRRHFAAEEKLESEVFRHCASLLTLDTARDRRHYLGHALRRLTAPGRKMLSLQRYAKLLRSVIAHS